MQVTCTLQNLINTQCWTLYLNWTDKKKRQRIYGCQNNFNVSDCSTLFSTCQALKYGSSYRGRVKLRKNDLKGNKSQREFRVTEGKITVNVQWKYRENRFWFELARVRVIGSRLYFDQNLNLINSTNNLYNIIPYKCFSITILYRYVISTI